MSTAPNLTAVDIDVHAPSAGSMIDTAEAKLSALADVLWMLVEHTGLEGGHFASIAYSIEDVEADLKRARDLLAVRP